MQNLEITSGKMPGAMKVVIYGPEGIGKSTLAAQFPRPLFLDTEGSTRFLDVSRLPKPTSWTMLMKEVRHIKANPQMCATLIIDTADWAEHLCIEGICANKQLSGIEDMGYGRGYVYLAEEFGRLLNLLEELVACGVHVVLTAHAMMRKFEQPDEMGAYDRWELKLQKKTAPLVKEWSDLLLFANYKTVSVATDDKKKQFKAQGGRRVMYTSHHPCWDAKNRLGLPDELPLDYAPLAQYFSNTANPPAVHTPPAPPTAEASSPAKAEEAPVPQEQSRQSENTGALQSLRDLMKQNGVADVEIQMAVAAKGYFPEQTPLESYPEDFIRGVLIGAWPQVHQWITENRPLPF